MDTIATKITEYILKKDIISKENFEIYKYGFVCFIELALSTLTSVVISLYLGMFLECLFFFLLFIPLRSFGGGIHMDKYWQCYIVSCAVLTVSLLLVKYVTLPTWASMLMIIVGVISLYIIGPINHANRDVTKEENAIFIKRTNITLALSIIISFILLFLKNSKFLFLEAIVFMFLLSTAVLVKFQQRKKQILD
ncbi:MAG: accessory gene regulator B family protein [Pseudobutyrivibrio sp.]|nr:accessory gene regulator B family protein [Pseudobutyrivibrio sp.]